MGFVKELNCNYPDAYLYEIANNIVYDFIKECKKHKTEKWFCNEKLMTKSDDKNHMEYKFNKSEYYQDDIDRIRDFVEQKLNDDIKNDEDCIYSKVELVSGYNKKTTQGFFRNTVDLEENDTFAIKICMGWGENEDYSKRIKFIKVPDHYFKYNSSRIANTLLGAAGIITLFYILKNSLGMLF